MQLSKHKRLIQKINAIEYLGTVCSVCNQAYHPAAMQFHHKKPEEKEHKLSSMFGSYSWDRIKAELNKCELLCANCHQVHHYINKE